MLLRGARHPHGPSRRPLPQGLTTAAVSAAPPSVDVNTVGPSRPTIWTLSQLLFRKFDFQNLKNRNHICNKMIPPLT